MLLSKFVPIQEVGIYVYKYVSLTILGVFYKIDLFRCISDLTNLIY